MAFFPLGHYQSFDIETILKNGGFYSKLCDVKQKHFKRKRNFTQNYNNPMLPLIRSIKKAGILPSAFHQLRFGFQVTAKTPTKANQVGRFLWKHSTVQLSHKISTSLSWISWRMSIKLGSGYFNNLADSRDKTITLKEKLLESKYLIL